MGPGASCYCRLCGATAPRTAQAAGGDVSVNLGGERPRSGLMFGPTCPTQRPTPSPHPLKGHPVHAHEITSRCSPTTSSQVTLSADARSGVSASDQTAGSRSSSRTTPCRMWRTVTTMLTFRVSSHTGLPGMRCGERSVTDEWEIYRGYGGMAQSLGQFPDRDQGVRVAMADMERDRREVEWTGALPPIELIEATSPGHEAIADARR
jgi:hypothetical protein